MKGIRDGPVDKIPGIMVENLAQQCSYAGNIYQVFATTNQMVERELEKVYEKQGARPKTVVKSATTDRPPCSLPKPNIRQLFSSDKLQSCDSCPKLDDLCKHSSLEENNTGCC